MGKYIENIKRLREMTHYPIWAIKKCLILEQNDINKAFARLRDIYFVMGDHPDKVIKFEEEKLRNMNI